MKLTKPQKEALSKLTNRWQSAYELGCSLSTLGALVKKDLAVSKGGLGSMFSPRTSILYKLRIQDS